MLLCLLGQESLYAVDSPELFTEESLADLGKLVRHIADKKL